MRGIRPIRNVSSLGVYKSFCANDRLTPVCPAPPLPTCSALQVCLYPERAVEEGRQPSTCARESADTLPSSAALLIAERATDGIALLAGCCLEEIWEIFPCKTQDRNQRPEKCNPSKERESRATLCLFQQPGPGANALFPKGCL